MASESCCSIISYNMNSIVLATLICLLLLLVSPMGMGMAMAIPMGEESIISSFSADLIHRDSPLSPFYNPSQTNSDRLHNAFHRSVARIRNRFNINIHYSLQQQLQSDHHLTAIYSGGEYFMNISIGTPPIVIPGNIDTGSDLTWTQCQPCINCFKQLSPIFDPKQSSTYIELPCLSLPCKAVGKLNFCTPQNLCGYKYSYADGAFTVGRVATETISIGSSVSLPDIFFGCSFDNAGVYDEHGSGIIGLGRGPLSFINQFLPSLGHKFSHCLVPPITSTSTSKIYFGADSVVSGDGVVSTPMVANGTDISFYYLVLDAVSVGENRIIRTRTTTTSSLLINNATNKKKNINQANGNLMIIIDSATTYTFLPHDFYDDLVVAIDKAIGGGGGGERVQDPAGILNLCYKTDDDIDAPIVTFHFSGNADVQLKTANTFIRMTEDVVCLTIAPTTDDVAVYGSLSQVNFLVGYDLDNQAVSFKPTDCTTQ